MGGGFRIAQRAEQCDRIDDLDWTCWSSPKRLTCWKYFFDGVEEWEDNEMQYRGAGAGRQVCEVLELKERAEPVAEL